MKTNRASRAKTETTTAPRSAASAAKTPRVVYTQAPVQLGVLLGREDEGARWRVRVGAVEQVLLADPAVDPALLEDASAQGARVLIDAAGEPVIVGVVLTARPLVVDRHGDVHAEVRRFKVQAREEALVQAGKAYVQLRAEELTLYGKRVVTRAREVAKILARVINLN